MPLVVRYAMTESPSICGTKINDPPEVQATTVGRPQHGVEVRVVDKDEGPVADGVVGRIRVRGPAVMRGYWRDLYCPIMRRTADAVDSAVATYAALGG